MRSALIARASPHHGSLGRSSRLRLVYGCSFLETGEQCLFGVRGCSRGVLASGPCSFWPVFEPHRRRSPASLQLAFGLFNESDSLAPAEAEIPRAFRDLFTPESSLPRQPSPGLVSPPRSRSSIRSRRRTLRPRPPRRRGRLRGAASSGTPSSCCSPSRRIGSP